MDVEGSGTTDDISTGVTMVVTLMEVGTGISESTPTTMVDETSSTMATSTVDMITEPMGSAPTMNTDAFSMETIVTLPDTTSATEISPVSATVPTCLPSSSAIIITSSSNPDDTSQITDDASIATSDSPDPVESTLIGILTEETYPSVTQDTSTPDPCASLPTSEASTESSTTTIETTVTSIITTTTTPISPGHSDTGASTSFKPSTITKDKTPTSNTLVSGTHTITQVPTFETVTASTKITSVSASNTEMTSVTVSTTSTTAEPLASPSTATLPSPLPTTLFTSDPSSTQTKTAITDSETNPPSMSAVVSTITTFTTNIGTANTDTPPTTLPTTTSSTIGPDTYTTDTVRTSMIISTTNTDTAGPTLITNSDATGTSVSISSTIDAILPTISETNTASTEVSVSPIVIITDTTETESTTTITPPSPTTDTSTTSAGPTLITITGATGTSVSISSTIDATLPTISETNTASSEVSVRNTVINTDTTETTPTTTITPPFPTTDTTSTTTDSTGTSLITNTVTVATGTSVTISSTIDDTPRTIASTVVTGTTETASTHPPQSSMRTIISDTTTTASTTVIRTDPPETSMRIITSDSTATTTTGVTTSPTTSTTSAPSTSTTTASSTSTSTTTTPMGPYNPDSCQNISQARLPDGTCVSKSEGQRIAFDVLSGNSSVAQRVIDYLALYISSTTRINAPLSNNITLSIEKIDILVKSLNSENSTVSANTSFVTSQRPNQGGNLTVLGATFLRGRGGQAINTANRDTETNAQISAAAFIAKESLGEVTSLSMLIIDDPTQYTKADNSSGSQLDSSVIVVGTNGSASRMNISLYFRSWNQAATATDGSYACSFYNTNTSKWDQSGCTTPIKNTTFDRFECSCNHLSTFALVRLPPSSIFCKNSTHFVASNGTCLSREETQLAAVNTLRNTTNSSVIVDALSSYFTASSNSSTPGNKNNSLSVDEIDELMANLNNVNVTLNTAESILVVKQPDQGNGVIVLGASFTRDVGSQLVNTNNRDEALKAPLSTAAVISPESLVGVISLNMLIIDKPTAFEKLENSTNKKLASSVVVAAVQRNMNASTPMNISLYFQVLNEYRPSVDVDYLCSFYDNRTNGWNESGCTRPVYKTVLDRYECSCNHLTSFALIWLPKTPGTPDLNAQDIASLVFQSLSTLCFLAVIIHALVSHLLNPSQKMPARDALPLVSCAATILLFVFYIALGMTVYTRKPDPAETRCFTSASVLMFFVYFFLIFMLCIKTSVGYFNYLRFVLLFPEPSLRKLCLMLIISFFISIAWVSFAAGFNSNASFNITQLYQSKICWFTRDVVYYFVTIPVAIFLVLNLLTIILVTKRIIDHVRNATSPHQSYERMKRCVVLLLSSCVTQGLGWLFGPFISFVNPEAANVLGWLFVVFNGLEGVWAILLYIVIRSQRLHELKRVIAAKELLESKKPSPIKKTGEDGQRRTNERDVFDDLSSLRTSERRLTAL